LYAFFVLSFLSFSSSGRPIGKSHRAARDVCAFVTLNDRSEIRGRGAVRCGAVRGEGEEVKRAGRNEITRGKHSLPASNIIRRAGNRERSSRALARARASARIGALRAMWEGGGRERERTLGNAVRVRARPQTRIFHRILSNFPAIARRSWFRELAYGTAYLSRTSGRSGGALSPLFDLLGQ